MKFLTGREWGASHSSRKSLYVALISLVLVYGCIVFGLATKSLLKRMEVIQTQSLQICRGAFKTSSISAIQVEMGRNGAEFKKDPIGDFGLVFRGIMTPILQKQYSRSAGKMVEIKGTIVLI